MSLFGISEEGQEVSFVEVREGENVYSSHHGPFLYITQFNLALYIITMSTETFLKVSMSTETFLKVSMSSETFLKVSMSRDTFLKVSMSSDTFLKVII